MAVLFLNESRLLEGVQQLLGNIKSTLVSTTPPIFGCSHGYHLTNNSEGCRESLFPFLSVCQFVKKKNEWDFTWSLWSQLFVPRAPSPQRGRVFCVHLGLIKMKRGGASAASAPQVLHLLEQHLSINVKKTNKNTHVHKHTLGQTQIDLKFVWIRCDRVSEARHAVFRARRLLVSTAWPVWKVEVFEQRGGGAWVDQ